jgi:hypothetical protein
MAKMNIAPKDRSRVRLECARLLLTLKLNQKRERIIFEFFDTYLDLTKQEMAEFMKRLDKLAEPEREAIINYGNSYERAGWQKGVSALLTKHLQRRLGPIETQLLERIQDLTPQQLDALDEALLDFASTKDLEKWLRKQRG